MAIASPIQNSLNTGEFSPLAYGRVDYAKYRSGAALMQDFVPMVQGGITRRTGTVYANPTKSNNTGRLVRFVFSTGDAFLLEFTDGFLRFYQNRAQVESAPGVPYEIASPYAIADVPFLRFQQSRDVLYISHPSYKPRKLSRTALTNWSFALVDFLDGPYLPVNSTTTTMTASAAAIGSRTITASSVVGINNGTGFQTTDVGRHIRIKQGVVWGWGIITAWTSTTVVTVDLKTPLTDTSASATWRLGEWSDTTLYPSGVFLYDDRLGWFASPVAPTTMNLSKSGDYENMAPTATTDSLVAADNALQIKINAKEQDPIRWAFDDEKGLVCGTRGGEYLVRASLDGTAMSAVNFPAARRSTKYGSANVEPVEAGKAVLFVQRSKRKIRELAYVYEVDGFRAPDMTILAEHVSKGKVAEMAYQQEPFSVVWTRMENGTLWGMTYDREQDVVGWHRHVIGGYYNAGKTQPARVESICSLPSPDGSQDDLWLIVARYIDGGIKRYVEFLSDFNTNYDSVVDCYFVDGGKIIDLGSKQTAVTGLGHLEGQTVQLLVDGSPQANQIVTGGAITLDRAGQYVKVGFPITARLKTLRPEAGSATGTAQGKTKRQHRAAARFHESVGVWCGATFEAMDAQDFRAGNHPMGQPVPIFSGDKQLDFTDDYNTDGYICLETRQALPCTILALMPQLHTQDAI